MLIGVDIDNVLAEFEAAFRAWINRHSGLSLKRRHITSFLFADCCPLSHAEVDDLFRSFVDLGHLRRLSLIPHARPALIALTRAADICLVTSRPESEPVLSDTLYWLERKAIPHQQLLFNGRKWEIESPFDLFIEDNLEQARGLAGRGVPVLLLDYPWNRAREEGPGIRRVSGWQEALAVARTPGRPAQG